jgi:hypothetical protein
MLRLWRVLLRTWGLWTTKTGKALARGRGVRTIVLLSMDNDGWYPPIYFVEEAKDPAKNLPRSMIGTRCRALQFFCC